ncbi:LysM peptidoglycan-binding domain-containing protein [Nitratifractor sp.]|uniref:LysM peptidoglycan-binding domain-containing protein n=1 Tax=Nitratifractor sp. TaxID=2268144 RepID=UPI0025D163F7|nr:LysM peptidoglycan-binding domain-containing protein [Nitratifractor sp.]
MSIKNVLLLCAFLAGTATVNAAHPKAGSAVKFTEYTIEAGDTLSGIAWRHHSSVKAIEKANGLSADTLLRPGQKLKIPLPSAQKVKTSERTKGKRASASAKRYEVVAGDTLSQIAGRFGITSEALRRANGLGKNSLIRVGQSLVIPQNEARKEKKAPTKTERKRKEAPASTPRAAPKPKVPVHTVQRGDTLFSIARKYHTPLQDLMKLNGITPTDIIKPGQILKIPGKSYQVGAASRKKTEKAPTPPKKIPPVYHTVHHGDTLWKIADRYGVTIREIRRLNGLRRGHIIHTGQKLMVKAGKMEKVQRASKPKTKTPPAPRQLRKVPRYYTVQHGDTLWDIARKEKISLTELRRLNSLKSGEMLHSGRKLVVGYSEVPAAKIAKKAGTKKKKVAKAKPSGKKSPKKTVAKKKKTTKKKRTKVASKTKRNKRRANKRINSAMAVLNGKGRSSGGYSSASGNAIIRTAKRYLGRRYVWGAEGPSTFDCSGFTQYVMKKSKGVTLPRVSRRQAYYGKYVTFSHLRPGDLIFFDTSHSRRGYVNHVGIYIGNGKFIHASSARHRVVITSFRSHPFYRARFKWGRRVN